MSRPDARAAALKAAEARLRPPPATPGSGSAASPPDSTSPSTSTPSGSVQGQGSGLGPSFNPTEKEDIDTRIKFSRALDRGIVRDGGYAQVATCVETLGKIAANILEHPDDPKYRNIRSTNSNLKQKVLNTKGGHEYLILMGFKTQVVDFEQHYVFQPTLKGLHNLQIGAEVLSSQLPQLIKRADNSSTSSKLAKADEAARVKNALAEIEADRDRMRAKARMDKVVREQVGQQQKDKTEEEKEERRTRDMRDMRSSAGREGGQGAGSADQERPEDEEEDEDYQPSDDEEDDGLFGGGGQVLGGSNQDASDDPSEPSAIQGINGFPNIQIGLTGPSAMDSLIAGRVAAKRDYRPRNGPQGGEASGSNVHMPGAGRRLDAEEDQ